MRDTTKQDMQSFLDQVCHRVAETDHKFCLNFDEEISGVKQPIPFFGKVHTAKILTVGVNPSSAEFKERRRESWASINSRNNELLARLLAYFDTDPHPWFKRWESALALLNASYCDGTAAHLDLSPRATIPMGQAPDQELFRAMVKEDLPIFMECLNLCRSAKVLLIAGSVTKKFYINEFIQQFSPADSLKLQGRFLRREHPGYGKTCWHQLGDCDLSLPVFFCGSSPSNRNNRDLLGERIGENKPTLLKYVLGSN